MSILLLFPDKQMVPSHANPSLAADVARGSRPQDTGTGQAGAISTEDLLRNGRLAIWIFQGERSGGFESV